MRVVPLFSLLVTPVLLFALACSSGEDDEIVPLPELTPFTPEQTERLHAIRDGIAELRGLSVARDIEEGSMSREEWQAYNQAAVELLSDEDRKDIEFYGSIWHLMRLIEPDQDVFDLSMQVSGSAIAGFYTFEERALVLVDDVADGELSISDESTMAHEYVHSFQDAHFDLEGFLETEDGEEDAVSEIGTTLPCVFEGDASLAGLLYMFEEHGFQSLQGDAEGIEQAREAIEDIPAVILEYSSFNYDECLNFVLLVYHRDEWPGVDALYENPPATTEQILHTQKYFDGEGAVVMPESDLGDLLGDGWKRFSVGAYGEFDVRTFLASADPEGIDAERAAEGWGGGRMALYRHGDAEDEDTLLHISLRWDTQTDFDEFGEAFRAALVKQGWHVAQASDHWYWRDGEDFGYALFDASVLHYDIIYATDTGAADIAKAALQGGLARSE